MCNIAGYVGNKQAAPILLEMLRRQQDYDGGLSTGIATVYEGRLYWRKIIGNVDDLINHTDALNLPGTIGIAHTRPGGTPKTYEHAHPFVTMAEDMALVVNGTGKINSKERNDAALMLDDEGYFFRSAHDADENSKLPRLRNGKAIHGCEFRVHLIDYYIKQGMSYADALAKTCTVGYNDNVTVILNQNEPNKIFALRTTRPMAALLADGETYIATTRFGFPENIDAEVMQLPLMHVCEITRDSVKITQSKIEAEPVCEVTPYAYSEAYKRITALLTGKKDEPLYFDDLEFAVGRDMKDIWPEQHTLVQDARLVYDVLYQLEQEGRLKSVVRPKPCSSGQVNRKFMWIE